MSVVDRLPSFHGLDWWDTWDYPNRILDQLFGTHVCDDDLLSPSIIRGFFMRPRSQANIFGSGQSRVINDDKKFEVTLNVSQFKPEEIEVKRIDNFIVIHGKHEERKEEKDEYGLVTREFTRRYMIPTFCEMQNVSSSLSPAGLLRISVPKKALKDAPKLETAILVKRENNNPTQEK